MQAIVDHIHSITGLQLIVILLLVMLRLLERQLEKSVTFDPRQRVDHRLPMDRVRDTRPATKLSDYDRLAIEVLRQRLYERRGKYLKRKHRPGS